MRPADYFTGDLSGGFPTEAVVLAVCNALWLVARRARTFAQHKPDSTLGGLGFLIVPIRFLAKVIAKLFGFITVGIFVLAAEIESFNVAVLAAFVGFAVAYGINYAISRYEQRLYPRKENASSH